jgi:hypothetical protein
MIAVSVHLMRYRMQTRLSNLVLLALSATVFAQSQMTGHPSQGPKTKPVSSNPAISPTEVAPAPAAPPTPGQTPPQRAAVSYASGQLTISASNSSLNQILREVSRLTGVKITGGVAEERVFGNYGPAEISDVLGELLDGTGSNMLLVAGGGDRASELILTPRIGGPTPPNPNATRFDDGDSDENFRQRANPVALPEAQSRPANENPVATPISPPRAESDNVNQVQAPPAAPAPADPTQQSPNGVKTPQQIYDELMRLRRQQQPQ